MAHWAAIYLLAGYTTATESPGPPTPKEVLRSLWEPPSGNWYKVNVDGALLTEHKSSGVGAGAKLGFFVWGGQILLLIY